MSLRALATCLLILKYITAQNGHFLCGFLYLAVNINSASVNAYSLSEKTKNACSVPTDDPGKHLIQGSAIRYMHGALGLVGL